MDMYGPHGELSSSRTTLPGHTKAHSSLHQADPQCSWRLALSGATFGALGPAYGAGSLVSEPPWSTHPRENIAAKQALSLHPSCHALKFWKSHCVPSFLNSFRADCKDHRQVLQEFKTGPRGWESSLIPPSTSAAVMDTPCRFAT